MNELYNDLITILKYAEENADDLPADISENNVRYIRGVVEGALEHVNDVPSPSPSSAAE
jgi:hypothetical protein